MASNMENILRLESILDFGMRKREKSSMSKGFLVQVSAGESVTHSPDNNRIGLKLSTVASANAKLLNR